jgi:hypothetical protein
MAAPAPGNVSKKSKKKGAPSRALPPGAQLAEAFRRLGRDFGLHTLVRGALPPAVLKRLLKDALPRHLAREIPADVWASLASSIALENPAFALLLAQELHDRLGWDREPPDLDAWWPVVRERPLEALWMAALSASKAVKREYAHIAWHCVDNYRESPECSPPSWEYFEGALEVQAFTAKALREAEKRAEEAEKRTESERERLEELRDELKRLRRENAELREQRARAARRASEAESQAGTASPSEAERRLEELEKGLRKSEKERAHLLRQMERLRHHDAAAPVEDDAEPAPDLEASPGPAETTTPGDDPNPRRRVLRQMLRKLFTKGKIGASHTHEDNVYRGVADHEKGFAKEAMELLYREGFLLPKPTVADPHVSLNPAKAVEIQQLIAGEVLNPRLRRFVETEAVHG